MLSRIKEPEKRLDLYNYYNNQIIEENRRDQEEFAKTVQKQNDPNNEEVNEDDQMGN